MSSGALKIITVSACSGEFRPRQFIAAHRQRWDFSITECSRGNGGGDAR
ncbi:hypothetical protein ACXA45_07250 [Neomicrococcus lactis]